LRESTETNNIRTRIEKKRRRRREPRKGNVQCEESERQNETKKERKKEREREGAEPEVGTGIDKVEDREQMMK
jgi:hypothetical protein